MFGLFFCVHSIVGVLLSLLLFCLLCFKFGFLHFHRMAGAEQFSVFFFRLKFWRKKAHISNSLLFSHLWWDRKGREKKIIAPLGHHSVETNCYNNTESFLAHIEDVQWICVFCFLLLYFSNFVIDACNCIDTTHTHTQRPNRIYRNNNEQSFSINIITKTSQISPENWSKLACQRIIMIGLKDATNNQYFHGCARHSKTVQFRLAISIMIFN